MKTFSSRIFKFNWRLRLVAVAILMTSCDDFLSIDPPKTTTVSVSVYADDATAVAAIRGIYHEMINSGFASGNYSSVSLTCGASADELISYEASINDFFNNSLTPSHSTVVNNMWIPAYKYIYYANSALEGLEKSTGVTASTKRQLAGEAKFIRAFCYFNLVNLFGNVPLLTTTDYRSNAVASRTSKDEVFEKIVMDLNDAKTLLTNDYSMFKGERVRATSGAASALLARVHLFIGNMALAEEEASNVINNSSLYGVLSDLNSVFLKNSKEAIWQLMPVAAGANTNEGAYLIPPSSSSVPQFVSITNHLLNAFEPGDNRRTKWIASVTVGPNTYYYPFKYKIRQTGQPLTEYSMVLRVAEQYLIRAEARATQNKLDLAVNDIDVIRLRAGLPLIKDVNPTISKTDILTTIVHEKQVELFSEWGHRWFDLKRLNIADQVLQNVKSNWQSTDVLFPLPASELVNNPNLLPQNDGY